MDAVGIELFGTVVGLHSDAGDVSVPAVGDAV
jgi:hypothetical protein